MIFTARSPSFIQSIGEAHFGVGKALHQAAYKTHQPWFVLTYLSEDEGSGSWETVCAQALRDILEHLKTRPQAQLASLLMMAPPRWSVKRKWSPFRVDFIERGKHQGAEVFVYHVAGRGQFCFDAPGVEAEDVTHRRRVLEVGWFRHFDVW
ncbi:hypothetical protein ACSFA3_00055 [Variovorax sp. RHLX14]|uniref:hypothetical protein n=1 Tax=Variovorax sp. RHLX14 TaxID=1259731 RepID=UPI003F4847BF